LNSTNSTFLTILGFVLFLSMSDAYALDVNSIVTKQCDRYSGVLIDVNQTDVKLISFDGQVQVIAVNDIDTIFTYGHKVNPFSKFDLNNASYDLLKDVYFDENQTQPDVTGWAIKYVEDLVFFYSVEGKMYVLSIEQIGKIRPYRASRKKIPLDYQPLKLEVSEYLLKCQFEQIPNEAEVLLRPVRILSDQIKISEFLGNFVKGKQNLDNFEERTYLYARPYLFPFRNRLSIPYFQNDFGLQTAMSFSYIWSTGRDYHFQSYNGVGDQLSENLPYLGPTFLIRSDFKSHFFSGSFEGNMLGLSAGIYPGIAFSDDGGGDNNKARAVESLNYLAIMGADYGPYSIGFGSYFPVHQIAFDRNNKRGVLAHKMSPLIRFLFIKRRFKLRLTAAQTKYNFDQNSLQDQIELILSDTSSKSFDELHSDNGVSYDDFSDYKFVSRFVRIGGEVDVYENIKLVADVVYTAGSYQETIAGTNNSLSFKNTAISVSVQHAFSHYVNLKAYYQLLKRNNEGTYKGESISNTQTLTTYGGQFELLF